MSMVADYVLSHKVFISGIVDKGIRELVKDMGGEIVTSIKRADSIIYGGFPDGWEYLDRKKRFGVKVNPIDAIDYVRDNKLNKFVTCSDVFGF